MILAHVSRMMVISGIAIMCAMAVALILFALFYQKKFVRQQMVNQQALLDASFELQERERERIARELHDGIGAMLAAAKLLVHRLPAKQVRTEVLKDLKEVLTETIQEARAVSRDLSPQWVRKKGLVGGLQKYCETLNNGNSIKINFFDQNTEVPSNSRAELSIYRIAQELIHNAIKHAQAGCVSVSLSIEGRWLRLSVKDDGQGFDLQNIQPHHGHGLLNVRSRLQSLGGHLQQQTISEPGTSLIANVPYRLFTNTTS